MVGMCESECIVGFREREECVCWDEMMGGVSILVGMCVPGVCVVRT